MAIVGGDLLEVELRGAYANHAGAFPTRMPRWWCLRCAVGAPVAVQVLWVKFIWHLIHHLCGSETVFELLP